MYRNQGVLTTFLSDSNSDDLEMLVKATEEEEAERERQRTHRRGSVPGRCVINRDRGEGHNRIYRDYFSDNPVYHGVYFRRRFRMHRPLFCRILSDVEAYDPYFVQKKDAVGIPGLSSLQKVIAAYRILAYGVPADFLDDHIRIGKSTSIESLRHFLKAIVAIYAEKYLRAPNEDDLSQLLQVNEQRGFPGMLGSIDCMHWGWKNCPSAWQSMYSGHYRKPTIILEAVASQDLWICHAFFGMPGSLNDINVLERSHVFSALTNGRAPPVNFIVNGNNYHMGYYLADGIYPSWATFVKTIPAPISLKAKHFAQAQEAARKDVERAFGVLQARYNIVRGPARFWDEETLGNIMKACIIMHNMVIEDEHGPGSIDFDFPTPNVIPSREQTNEFRDFIQIHHQIRDRTTHSQLQHDLVEHLWDLHDQD
ncbi:PREDICTED: putative nuclease HARBI1 [Erythranthe guttata]|uniref:putative nuclease HARBI1 n=1 Tax=Erythranthe guttata TaxID=4155 RepID=UPI00064DA0AA|nr:PREDICTED: putative nuclease HARBI1 [Erythranthe guttata]|eukprot:XP_012859009.1 PREDICTED: putative nuclease HARBI1 [Erythranthe guttata]